MRAPVSVSVQDTAGYWHQLPSDLAGIQYSSTAPGGPGEATIPVSSLPLLPDLQQGCRARISDGTTGKVLWTGRVSSPVRQLRGILQSGDPSFEGQAGYLGDHSIRYTPLVTRLDAWWLGSEKKPYVVGATADAGTTMPTNSKVACLLLQLPAGYRSPGDCSLASFHGFYDTQDDYSALSVRAFIGTHREGAAVANQSKFSVYLWHNQPDGHNRWTANATNAWTKVALTIDPDQSSDLSLGFQYTGAAVNTNDQKPAVKADEMWSAWWNLQVFRTLRKLDGTNVTGWDPTTVGGLYPHQIVTDLLGTFAFKAPFDQDTTLIDDQSTVLITSYDFSDMASIADILTDLNALVPEYNWSVGPCDTDGKFPVYWTRWADSPILQAPPGAVTYDEAAGEQDLANAVTYTYTDSNGRTATNTIYADPWQYPQILRFQQDGFGQVEAPPLDLTGLASASAALQVATAYLGQVATLPRTASATVDVPLVDQASGALIPPWELVAGVRVHVPETGDTVHCTAVQVDVDSATATLTLGLPRRSTDQIVTTMSKHRKKTS